MVYPSDLTRRSAAVASLCLIILVLVVIAYAQLAEVEATDCRSFHGYEEDNTTFQASSNGDAAFTLTQTGAADGWTRAYLKGTGVNDSLFLAGPGQDDVTVFLSANKVYTLSVRAFKNPSSGCVTGAADVYYLDQ